MAKPMTGDNTAILVSNPEPGIRPRNTYGKATSRQSTMAKGHLRASAEQLEVLLLANSASLMI